MAPRASRHAGLWPLAGLVALAGVAALLAGVLVLDGNEPSGPVPAPGIAAALRGARPADEPFRGLSEARLAVGGRCLRLVVADVPAERATGLTGRRDLGAYEGMLFTYDGSATSRFTMAGVPVPLQIAFYRADGDPVGTPQAMVPCARARAECRLYSAGDPYRFALETLGGDLPAGSLGACA